jgi:hypothetical protein
LKIFGSSLSNNIKSTDFGFIQINFWGLFYHIIKGWQENLWEALTKVRSI